MIAGEQDEANWDAVNWVRTALWVIAALLLANAAVFASNSHPWLAGEDVVLATVAAVAAYLMGKRDDRGWWLAIAVMVVGFALSVVMAVANWAISELAGSWIALYILWTLRQPPRFPWRDEASASSA